MKLLMSGSIVQQRLNMLVGVSSTDVLADFPIAHIHRPSHLAVTHLISNHTDSSASVVCRDVRHWCGFRARYFRPILSANS